jgi:2-(1,2-epoxy-1,2-dihydrophenyl)acetyl-CoA isomerase
MASANLDLVRSIYAAWERGDFSEDEWADPEIEFVRADTPEAGSWGGRAGMATAFREFLSAWENVRIEATQYQELDDERVLVLVHFRGRGKTSGVELGQVWTKGASLFQIRRGKVTRLVAYADYERALADLGPAPEDRTLEVAEHSEAAVERGHVSVERGDVSVELADDFVATVEIHRPPDNYIDVAIVAALADAYEKLERDPACRAIVLCSEGKHFSAGVAFGPAPEPRDGELLQSGNFYREAIRLFAAAIPVVAAVQGAAVGGGLGLALSADFRVASPESRFWANFARLGFHHGFGMTVTLPALVGQQVALDLLYTGRRVPGEEARSLGLCDRVVPAERIRIEAHALAAEIATSAPLAVRSIRQTLRGDLADRVRAATEREQAEQLRLMQTDDFHEGVRAVSERREPEFGGR